MAATKTRDARAGGNKAGGRSADRPHRGQHDGTIYFDHQREQWRGEITLEGRRYKFRAASEAAIRRKLAARRKEFYDWALTEPNHLTVEQVVTDWLENVVRKRRRASTYSQYESPLRIYFLPRFGSRLVRNLQPRDLERFYAELEEGEVEPRYKLKPDGTPWRGGPRRGVGLSPKSIRNLHTGLHAAFARAVRHRLIPRNPADNVELPRLPRRRKLHAEPEHVQRLLAFSEAEFRAGTDSNFPLFCFLANTGLRIGEALALRWSSVDLDEGWFVVDRDLDRDSSFGEVKTEASEREVPMTVALRDALRRHQERQDEVRQLLGSDYDDHDLVFATATGRPNNERNALRSLHRAVKRAEVPVHLELHDFRRMAASMLLAGGVDIVTAAAILGHRRASVLLDVYAKALRAPKRDAAERLQAVLYPASSAPPILPPV